MAVKVRIVDRDHQVNVDRPDPAGADKRPSGSLLIGGALAVALLVLGGYLLGKGANAPATVPSPSTATTAAATTSTTPTSTTPSAGGPTRAASSSGPGSGTTLDGALPMEAVPGMFIGMTTVATGYSQSKYGIPYGWPKTIYGATGAAMNFAGVVVTLPYLVDSTRDEVKPYLFTADGLPLALTPEGAARIRKAKRIGPEGGVVFPDGRPSTTEKYYGGGLPRYGAYKVLSIDGDDQAVIEVAVPYVSGPGTDDNLSEVFVGCVHVKLTMRWTTDGPAGGDWRVSNLENLPTITWPMKKSNIGYPALRQLLGYGWVVPADATTVPYPGSVWAA